MKNEKKNGADTEMGYCPFEHKVGRAGRALGERGAGAWYGKLKRATRGAQARGTVRRGACAALRHGSLALRHDRLGGHDKATARTWACLRAPGRAGWVVCVHTVHLSSFWT